MKGDTSLSCSVDAFGEDNDVLGVGRSEMVSSHGVLSEEFPVEVKELSTCVLLDRIASFMRSNLTDSSTWPS